MDYVHSKTFLEPTQIMAAAHRLSTPTTIVTTDEDPVVKTDKETGEKLLVVFKPPHALEKCAQTLALRFGEFFREYHVKGQQAPVTFKDNELPKWYGKDAKKLLNELVTSSIVALRSRMPIHQGFSYADQNACRQNTKFWMTSSIAAKPLIWPIQEYLLLEGGPSNPNAEK